MTDNAENEKNAAIGESPAQITQDSIANEDAEPPATSTDAEQQNQNYLRGWRFHMLTLGYTSQRDCRA